MLHTSVRLFCSLWPLVGLGTQYTTTSTETAIKALDLKVAAMISIGRAVNLFPSRE